MDYPGCLRLHPPTSLNNDTSCLSIKSLFLLLLYIPLFCYLTEGSLLFVWSWSGGRQIIYALRKGVGRELLALSRRFLLELCQDGNGSMPARHLGVLYSGLGETGGIASKALVLMDILWGSGGEKEAHSLHTQCYLRDWDLG